MEMFGICKLKLSIQCRDFDTHTPKSRISFAYSTRKRARLRNGALRDNDFLDKINDRAGEICLISARRRLPAAIG